MENSTIKFNLGIALILGSVWGLSEIALGMGLKACAANMSGSVMTAVALFFLAAGWALTRRWFVPILIVLVASMLKLFDALILGLPVLHGAIANPIFAFWIEAIAILLIIAVFSRSAFQSRRSRILLGGGAALISAGMFPLVGFATSVPACVVAGTTVPLSIAFAPVAILLSMITVPLGFFVSDRFHAGDGTMAIYFGRKRWSHLVSPATMVICMVLIFLIRILIPMHIS